MTNPNEEKYDPERHHICIVCEAKLRGLAQAGTAFGRRKQVRLILAPAAARRVVTLTTGYVVQLDEAEGLEHLFSAIIGEVLIRLEHSPEFRDRGFALIFDVCLCELHFIAGQLYALGSAMDAPFLLDEFGVHWDSIASKLRDRRQTDE